jgi:hypothetical protein
VLKLPYQGMQEYIMERMIEHITGYKQEAKKRKEEKIRNRTYSPQETVRQLSLFDVS